MQQIYDYVVIINDTTKIFIFYFFQQEKIILKCIQCLYWRKQKINTKKKTQEQINIFFVFWLIQRPSTTLRCSKDKCTKEDQETVLRISGTSFFGCLNIRCNWWKFKLSTPRVLLPPPSGRTSIVISKFSIKDWTERWCI